MSNLQPLFILELMMPHMLQRYIYTTPKYTTKTYTQDLNFSVYRQ